MKITIRKATIYDWDAAISLAWSTFLQFEAEIYGKEGTDHFRDFISSEELQRMFLLDEYKMFVALCEEKIVGVISLRDTNHISLLFVDKEFHKRGIGRYLVREACSVVREESDKQVITVNAAPYATEFYHKLGFKDVAAMQKADGITFTPMGKNLYQA